MRRRRSSRTRSLLEPERVRVPARQRVLERRPRRQLGVRGQVEQRPDLGQDRGATIVQGHLIIRVASVGDMGRRAYLRPSLGPCIAAVAVLLLALVSPARAAAPTPSDPTLAVAARPGPERPARRSRTHGGARGRPSHRRRRLLAQPVARARPRLEPEAAGRIRGPVAARPGLPLPHRGRRQRHARWRRLARRPLAAWLRRPDARTVRPARLSPPRWPPGGSAASTEP